MIVFHLLGHSADACIATQRQEGFTLALTLAGPLLQEVARNGATTVEETLPATYELSDDSLLAAVEDRSHGELEKDPPP